MQPVKKIVSGNVSASIWENQSTSEKADELPKITHSISVQKSFKDKEGKWQHRSSFKKNDLPHVMLATQKAFEYLALKSP